MPVTITETTVKNILTRTSGFLRTVTSHSLQPYCGCTFGGAACGVGCYVRHNGHLLQGREWGSFMEVRTNAAESYLANAPAEHRWAQRRGMPFGVFCSSSTDPFVPQEARFHVTESVLRAMLTEPPDELVLQTHSHKVAESVDLLCEVGQRCRLRVHVSIETDLDPFPGLPPHASPVERRLEACARLRQAGLRTVVTVSPLLPIGDPERFFARLAEVADAVVIDHFIQGDGSSDGSRTFRTGLPAAMQAVDPTSTSLAFRGRIVEIARRHLPGRVGVNIDGFAGRYS